MLSWDAHGRVDVAVHDCCCSSGFCTAVKEDYFSNSIFIPQFIMQGQLPYKCSCLSPLRQQLGAGDVNSTAEFAHML